MVWGTWGGTEHGQMPATNDNRRSFGTVNQK